MGNVLHQLFAQILKEHAATMTDVVAHPARHADLAACHQTFEPGGDVHAVAENITLLDHDVADIDPDPEAHLSAFRLIGIGALERVLHFDCATDGVDDAREFGKHAVAGCICDPAPMLPDQIVDHGAMGG